MKKVKVLLIDDDIRVLNGYKRILEKFFDVKMAHNPIVGLKILKKEGDIAVVISDFMMPKVDGNLFFEAAREISPNSVRIMLSGNADLSTAVDAINKSAVYKLLIKPYPASDLKDVIFEAIEIYNEQVERGSLQNRTYLLISDTLKDFISIMNPRDGYFVNSIIEITETITKRIKFKNSSKIIIAASLSQLGFISLPTEIKSKVYNKKKLTPNETNSVEQHPKFAKEVVLKKPILSDLAAGIEAQNKDFIRASSIRDKLSSDIARILRISIDFSINLIYYDSYKRAIKELERNYFIYDPQLLKVLKDYTEMKNENYTIMEVSPMDVKEGMIVARDYMNSLNELLITKGSLITSSLKLKLMGAYRFNTCKDKILVKVKELEA